MPTTDGYAAHHRLLDVLRRWHAPSFVVVIKDCGAEGKGMLSFPKPGISYAIDMPVSAQTQAIVDALNEVVVATGGRIYLAKDAFTRAEHFRAMEPRLDAWTAVRRRWAPTGACVARSRCGCSEISRETRLPRRRQGHGPGAGALARRGAQLS